MSISELTKYIGGNSAIADKFLMHPYNVNIDIVRRYHDHEHKLGIHISLYVRIDIMFNISTTKLITISQIYHN